MLIQTIVCTETTIFQDESNAVFGVFLQRLFIKSVFSIKGSLNFA